MAIDRSNGDVERQRGLLDRQPGEIAQLHRLRGLRLFRRQSFERLIEGEQIVVGVRGYLELAIEVDALKLSAMPHALLASRILHEDSPHGLGGGGKEMPAVIPLLGGVAA